MNMNCYFFTFVWCGVTGSHMAQPYGPAPGGPKAQAVDGQPIWLCCVTASHSMPNESKKITICVHFFCKTCLGPMAQAVDGRLVTPHQMKVKKITIHVHFFFKTWVY